MDLLIIEDNDGLREQMKWALQDTFKVFEANSSARSLEVLSQTDCKLICLDMGLDNIPDRGLRLIDEILSMRRDAKIVVITAHSSDSLGKAAIASGAFDYLRKPVDIDELRVILSRAERILKLEYTEEKNDTTQPPLSTEIKMIGESGAMKKIYSSIKKLSRTDMSVLITGESGTGKELCARAIHSSSQRSGGPFVPINCSAIPDTLLESELFGYAKGAFTGAQVNKRGLIETANRGTLFLDEIGDMPVQLQTKLLRFLEDQNYQRLGDTNLYKADVRIVAATNRSDFKGGDSHPMRSDLYYRLSEYEIHLPPLREREKDVQIIANHILERNRKRFSMPKLRLSTRALQALLNYSWPGNVRELENKLSHAALACEGQVIEPVDLKINVESFERVTFRDARDMFEKTYITNALREAQYKITVAAKISGLSRPRLYDLIKKHGIMLKSQTWIEEKRSGCEKV